MTTHREAILANGPREPARPADQRVNAVISAIAAGRFVVVADDMGATSGGALVAAADAVDATGMAFMVRHTSGLVCVALTSERADALELGPMAGANTEPNRPPFTVSVDLRHGTTAGISAADRAATTRALAQPTLRPDALARPGHILPLRARSGGVLRLPGRAEAAVDLAMLAGRQPAGVLAEIVMSDGVLCTLGDLRRFAAHHGMPLVTIADLVAYRRRHETLIERTGSVPIATAVGTFVAHAYRSVFDGVEHAAFVMGEVRGQEGVLVRVHSECLTGDVLGSLRCDCGPQLAAARAAIGRSGAGVIVYLRDHEGRGIGLGRKLQAYGLQDAGFDTVEANLALGLPVDSRDYAIGSQILLDLGVASVRLMTNNPAKHEGMTRRGIHIEERLALVVDPNVHNSRYLETKRTRLGHHLSAISDQRSATKASSEG